MLAYCEVTRRPVRRLRESYDLHFAVNARGATPMIDAAQSRFDMLLVEGFTPSTAGAGRGCRTRGRDHGRG